METFFSHVFLSFSLLLSLLHFLLIHLKVRVRSTFADCWNWSTRKHKKTTNNFSRCVCSRRCCSRTSFQRNSHCVRSFKYFLFYYFILLIIFVSFAFSLQERFERLYDLKLRDSLRADTKKGVVFGLGIGNLFCMLYLIYGTFLHSFVFFLSSFSLFFIMRSYVVLVRG